MGHLDLALFNLEYLKGTAIQKVLIFKGGSFKITDTS